MTYLKLPLPEFPLPRLDHVLGRRLVQRHDGLAPVAIAKGDPVQRVRIEHGPVSLQSHAVVPHRPADDAVAAALVLDQGKPLFAGGRSAVLAMRCHVTSEEGLDGSAAEGESGAAVGEPCLEIVSRAVVPSGRGRAHVDGHVGVKGREEPVHCIPHDVSVKQTPIMVSTSHPSKPQSNHQRKHNVRTYPSRRRSKTVY